MIQAYKNYWKNYTNFKDRTSVSGYWWVVLANFLASFVIGFIAGIIAAVMGINSVELADDYSNLREYLASPENVITSVWSLVNIIPGLAISFRRLHDTNRSGWLLFVPYAIIGSAIAGIIFVAISGTDAEKVISGLITVIFLLGIVLTVYYIVLLVFFCSKSVNEGNRYGDKQV